MREGSKWRDREREHEERGREEEREERKRRSDEWRKEGLGEKGEGRYIERD